MAAGYDRRICLCEAAVRLVEAFWSKNLMGHGKSRKRSRESFLWLLMAYGENNRKTGELK
jgi:hypothetical protein|nr:MAG TPA: hypothetical protein [Caudoviricetes sp.]